MNARVNAILSSVTKLFLIATVCLPCHRGHKMKMIWYIFFMQVPRTLHN